MKSQIKFSKPKVHHFNYNLKKNWFVGFSITNQSSGITLYKQFRGGINYYKNVKDRLTEANALKTYWQEQLELGLYNPFEEENTNHPRNIRQAFERIIQLKSTSLKPKSLRNYKDISRWFLEYCQRESLDQLPLNKLPSNIGRAYTDYILLEKKVSGTTFNNQMGILKAMVNNMMEEGREWLDKNPFDKIQELKTGVGNNVAYTKEEREQIRDFLYNHNRMLYNVTQFMFHCFIRKTELTTIRAKDFDWDNMTIKIDAKSAKNRIQDSVTIPEGLIHVIEEMNIKRMPSNYYIFGAGFQSCDKKLTRPDTISDRYLEAKRRIMKLFDTTLYEGDGKTLYSWKHTGVVAYWHVVKDPYYMMRQLRHHDLKTTMIYLKSLGLMPNEAFKNAKVIL